MMQICNTKIRARGVVFYLKSSNLKFRENYRVCAINACSEFVMFFYSCVLSLDHIHTKSNYNNDNNKDINNLLSPNLKKKTCLGCFIYNFKCFDERQYLGNTCLYCELTSVV